jgi:hypothetical protein
MTSAALRAWGQADLDLLPADHDCPAHRDREFVRTARRHHIIEIQVGPHTPVFADYGGKRWPIALRAGNAGSITASEHNDVPRVVLAPRSSGGC